MAHMQVREARRVFGAKKTCTRPILPGMQVFKADHDLSVVLYPFLSFPVVTELTITLFD